LRYPARPARARADDFAAVLARFKPNPSFTSPPKLPENSLMARGLSAFDDICRVADPGLDEFVKHGDPKRRAERARRIAELFLLGAANFRPDHVDLFDGVLIDLVPHTELAALPRILRARA
jgi:hypothetical protein